MSQQHALVSSVCALLGVISSLFLSKTTGFRSVASPGTAERSYSVFILANISINALPQVLRFSFNCAMGTFLRSSNRMLRDVSLYA
jgi:hypothetical protein